MTSAKATARPVQTTAERFWEKVEKTDTCWLWTGLKSSAGYGRFVVAGPHRHRRAHRLAYELMIGPIPEGLTIDHLCRVRHCVNPAHLEAVTLDENTRRGVSPPADNARRTHCQNGHLLAGDNVVKTGKAGRRCRLCRIAWTRAWRAANPEAERERERARNLRRKERSRVAGVPL